MRIVIQRVKEASVTIGGTLKSSIGQGMMILVGICDEDTDEDIEYLCQKVMKLRIFDDSEGVMNLPITDIAGSGILVVSQFTLMASTKKGNRPSYIHAAGHDLAVPLYDAYCDEVASLLGKPTKKGVFGAEMQVALVNDGPVTIIIDSRLKE